jgi:hypothetical protein
LTGVIYGVHCEHGTELVLVIHVLLTVVADGLPRVSRKMGQGAQREREREREKERERERDRETYSEAKRAAEGSVGLGQIFPVLQVRP